MRSPVVPVVGMNGKETIATKPAIWVRQVLPRSSIDTGTPRLPRSRWGE
jgi:hypothetical protein